MRYSLGLTILITTLLIVGCGKSDTLMGPEPVEQPPTSILPLPPVYGPQWIVAAEGGGIEVYFEIFYACSCPNYARTFLFWDTVNRREIGRVEFTLADGWWINYINPSQDFQVTPDGSRMGVRFYKSTKFYDQYRIYDLHHATELLRITRDKDGRPFIIEDENGATTGVSLSNSSVTLTLMIPTMWSETDDPEDPWVYGTFYPESVSQTFSIPSAR